MCGDSSILDCNTLLSHNLQGMFSQPYQVEAVALIERR